MAWSLRSTVIPISNLLGEAILDCSLRLFNQRDPRAADLCHMLGHDMGNSIALCLLLQVAVDPFALGPIEERFRARLAST